MARPGHRPSTIDKLEGEIKRLIAKWRIEDGWTIDEILAKLHELEQPVSRSALARHTRSLEEIGAQLRHSREMAKALVEIVGREPEDKLADLNVELAHTLVMRLATADASVELDAEEVKFIAQSLQSLAAARKIDVDRQAKLKLAAEKTVLERVERTMGEAGMSTATILAIRSKVLGDGD